MLKKNQADLDKLAAQGIKLDVPQVEVVDKQEIALDPIAAQADLAELARSEAFMNEILRIRVATTTDVNAPQQAIVTVNDVNNRAVIPRGIVVPVKRCHVEVLARMRETRFTQPTRNPMDPEGGNYLIPHHAQVYPFEVVEDKNPAGKAWFEALMNEPVY